MSITDEQAQTVINAAVAKSEELGYAITVAVVDSAGEISAVRRMDGVGPINFDFAYSCAYTSATTSRSGVELDGGARTRTGGARRASCGVAGSW